MKTDFFDYSLPKELIAQIPSKERDNSRLMILDRQSGSILHKKFFEIIDFLNLDDLLVINDTKVLNARIFGQDRRIRDILLIKEIEPLTWQVFIKPQRGLKIGEKLSFNNISAVIDKRTNDGAYTLRFSEEIPLSTIGFAPLPPYIKRDYRKPDMHEYDKIRYQTIYAKNPGAIAAPTAGLHFTENLLEKIKDKGIIVAPITLNVGIGTFRPVRTEYVKDHKMHPEYYCIPKETTEAIRSAKFIRRSLGEGGRVIAVGTTTARALETSIEGSGYTNLYIYPPYKFKIVNGLITNFHLPKSTLLMLVSAFAGREFIMEAYEEAINYKYKFYSYGDAMLIL